MAGREPQNGISAVEDKCAYLKRSIEPFYGHIPAFNAANARGFHFVLAELISEHHKDMIDAALKAGWDGKIGDPHMFNTLATEIVNAANHLKDASAKFVLAAIAKPETCEEAEEMRTKARKRVRGLLDRVQGKDE